MIQGNTGTELTVDGNVVQRRLGELVHIGGNLDEEATALVSWLNTGQVPNKSLGAGGGLSPSLGSGLLKSIGQLCRRESRWDYRSRVEIWYGDTLMYIGEPVPNFGEQPVQTWMWRCSGGG